MGKLFDRVRNNPRDDWTLADVRTLCAQEGLDCLPPSGGGSHWKVSHPHAQEILTVPARRPIKPVYLRKLTRMIEGIRAAQADEAKKTAKGKKA